MYTIFLLHNCENISHNDIVSGHSEIINRFVIRPTWVSVLWATSVIPLLVRSVRQSGPWFAASFSCSKNKMLMFPFKTVHVCVFSFSTTPSNIWVVCLGFFFPIKNFSLIWRRHHNISNLLGVFRPNQEFFPHMETSP